jgi:rhodanese-related sulfurtransferase
LLTGATLLVALVTLAYEASRARGGGQSVGPNEAVRLLNQGAVMLDVRPRDQFDAGHVIEARNMPSADVAQGSEAIKRFRDKVVITCCETGMSGAPPLACCDRRGIRRSRTCAAGCKPGAPRTCHSCAATQRPAERMSERRPKC